MAATAPGSGGGGGAPLVTWMLGMDASDAVAEMKGFSDTSAEQMAKFTERAKAMFPGKTFDAIAKEAKASFGQAAKDLAAFGYAAERAFEKAEKAAERAASRMKDATGTLKNIGLGGLGVGVLGVGSLVSQGNATSGLGAMSSFYNEQLARQVAGVFAPITQENMQRVAEMTGWFRKLSGSQQESIRTMAMFTATTGILLTRLPAASSALATFAGASAGVASAFGVGGTIASIGIGLAASTPEGRDALVAVAKSFEPVLDQLMEVVKEFRPAVADFGFAVKKINEWANIKILANTSAWDAILPNPKALELATSLGVVTGGARLMGFNNATAGRSDLTPRPNGFEAPVDTWERLNAAAQVLDVQKQTADNTASAAKSLTNIEQSLRSFWNGVTGGLLFGNNPTDDLVVDD